MITWKKIVLACTFLGAGCSLPAAKVVENRDLRINDIQVIGSHNSYRRLPPVALLDAMAAHNRGNTASLLYDHPPLAQQLDLGVRQIELDVVADPVGGRYATPLGEDFINQADRFSPSQQNVMQAPGFKTLHMADWDYLSHCLTLRACLKDIADWSNRNPGHLPILITIDSKDRPHGLPNVVDPIPLTRPLLDELDAEIRAGLGPLLITPDMVRGGAENLRQAILEGQWPKLSEARGRFVVIFDVRPELADLYKTGHPSLRDRAMFAQYPENTPEASVFIVQDPRGEEARIINWVKAGFLVRTRSDAGTTEARNKDNSRLMAAIRSGAQAISTDFYPGAPDPLGTGFVASFGKGRTFTCNPVRVRGACPTLESSRRR